MKNQSLGVLEKIDLRSVWLHEATEFTPWLAQENNLAILAETIGMELELEAQEKNVGPFRADILCKDLETENWVLIENQLARTDHGHLGQLLTYAAGLQAVTIVWIAATFTEEHRETLDWLNKITDERFQFFGLEVELWRIGDSPPAPRFNIISKPNRWTRQVGRAARQISDEAVTETKALQLRYWQALKEHLDAQGSPVRIRKPRPEHWTSFSIGRSGFHMNAKVNTRENFVAVELVIQNDDAKIYYSLLEEQKADIEADVGSSLIWKELPERISSYVELRNENTDPTDESDWPNQHAWLVDALTRMNNAFRQRVRALDVNDYEPGTEAAE